MNIEEPIGMREQKADAIAEKVTGKANQKKLPTLGFRPERQGNQVKVQIPGNAYEVYKREMPY